MGALEVVGIALALAGVAVVTLSTYGLFRMPDVYMQLHSAAKAVALGVLLVALASIGTGDWTIITRALLVAVFTLLTTPASSHAIARAAFIKREPMAGPDAVDESGWLRPPGERENREAG